MILLCTKNPVPNWWSPFPAPQKMYNPLPVQCHPSPIWPPYTKSNLHFPISLTTVFKEPVLYRLLTFHVPNLMSILRCLGRAKESVLGPRPSAIFRNQSEVLRWGVVSPPAEPPSRRATPCRLSATAYSIYSLLPSISGGRLWGRAMPWWQRTHLTLNIY
jgi:hypothetical protein